MKRFALAMVALVVCAGAQAASDEVEMNLVTSQGVGQSIGTVKITETDKGLEFAPNLKALPPGEHGFHVHAKGSCQPAMKEGKPSAALMIHVGGDNMSDQPKPLGGGGARYACGVI